MSSFKNDKSKGEKSIYDYDQQMVGEAHVNSSWQQAREYKTGKTQTETIIPGQKSTQTIMSAIQVNEGLDKETQTKGRTGAIPQPVMDGMQFVYRGDHYNEEELATFLESVVGEISDALANNNKSSAFDNYQPNWMEKLDTVSQFLTLTPPFVLTEEYHVTSISWNSTGSNIAIAYGRIDTVGWAKKKGYVCLWNLSRREMNPNHPDLTLEANSYVTAVAFHPLIPSMLAAGTYNGEVVLWNLADTTMGQTGANTAAATNSNTNLNTPMTSLSSTQSPKEPIARLQWLQNVREQNTTKRYLLCSASQDGKVLFWNPYKKLADAEASYDVQNKKHCVIGVQGMCFVCSAGTTHGKGAQCPKC